MNSLYKLDPWNEYLSNIVGIVKNNMGVTEKIFEGLFLEFLGICLLIS